MHQARSTVRAHLMISCMRSPDGGVQVQENVILKHHPSSALLHSHYYLATPTAVDMGAAIELRSSTIAVELGSRDASMAVVADVSIELGSSAAIVSPSSPECSMRVQREALVEERRRRPDRRLLVDVVRLGALADMRRQNGRMSCRLPHTTIVPPLLELSNIQDLFQMFFSFITIHRIL